MVARKIASALVALAILGIFLLPKLARGQTGIIVNNADSVLTLDTTASQSLEDITRPVSPRNVAQYADSTWHYNLADIPSTLQLLVEDVTPRNVAQYADSTQNYNLSEMPAALQALVAIVTPGNVVQYADSIGRYNLATIPVALQSLVKTVTPRNVVQYTDSTITYALGYPLALMGDSSPPKISTISDHSVGDGAVTITWTTDEFADSVVVYGTKSGAYILSASDSLFVKQHVITLTQLAADTTYYYKTRSTDQSKNTAQSAENDFMLQSQKYLYLPVVLK